MPDLGPSQNVDLQQTTSEQVAVVDTLTPEQQAEALGQIDQQQEAESSAVRSETHEQLEQHAAAVEQNPETTVEQTSTEPSSAEVQTEDSMTAQTETAPSSAPVVIPNLGDAVGVLVNLYREFPSIEPRDAQTTRGVLLAAYNEAKEEYKTKKDRKLKQKAKQGIGGLLKITEEENLGKTSRNATDRLLDALGGGLTMKSPETDFEQRIDAICEEKNFAPEVLEKVEAELAPLDPEKDADKIKELLGTIPPEHFKSKYGRVYSEQVKSGTLRKRFPEWFSENAGASSLEKMGNTISNLFTKIARLIANFDFLPDGLQKWAQGVLDKKEEKNPFIDDALTTQAEQATNTKAWETAPEATKQKFETFRTNPDVMGTLSFIDGKQVEATSDFKSIGSSTFESSWETAFADSDIAQLLAWANSNSIRSKDGFAEISKESWEKIVAQKDQITVANGKVSIKTLSGQERTLLEWNDRAIDKAFEQSKAETLYAEHATKFGVEFKDLAAFEKTVLTKNKESFKGNFKSLLKLPAESWDGYQMTKADLEAFAKYSGKSPWGKKRFDNDADAFHTRGFGFSKLVLEGAVWEKRSGEYDDVKSEFPGVFEVDGSGGLLAEDYDFENVKAFFDFLKSESLEKTS